MNEYDGKQFVGIDLHRRHSVIVRQTSTGERLSAVRILNDPDSLALQLGEAGEHPDVVLEATFAASHSHTQRPAAERPARPGPRRCG